MCIFDGVERDHAFLGICAEAQGKLLEMDVAGDERFAWQQGFGAFGVSASHRDEVIAYIHNQPEHHKKRSFEEEFVAPLKAVGVAYDPKYVFG
jgi:hypothetical protein